MNNKSYTRAFDEKRSLEAYEANQKIIDAHNKEFEIGRSSFRLAPNQMADMVLFDSDSHKIE